MSIADASTSRRRYSSHGLAPDAQSALGSMLEVLRGRTRDAWTPAALRDSHVLFLGDHAEAPPSELVSGIRHVVRVSRGGESRVGSALRLDYPFRVFQLLSLMQEIEDEGSVAQTPPVIARHGSWALFDSLQALAQATPQGAWLVARWDDGESLHVRDDLGEFAVSGGASDRLFNGGLPQVPLASAPPPPPSLARVDGARLTWRVGLHSGRGQLSGSVDPQQAYRLRVWPDFGRVGSDRLHVRLSALLSREPLRRDDLVRLAGQRDEAGTERVNRFLNACVASGLLRSEGGAALRPAETPTPASGFVGTLVSRIRHRLGFGLALTER